MDESERIACLETKTAVHDEQLKQTMQAIRDNTAAMNELLKRLEEYPVYRERVNNMWKLVTGAIGTALASICAAIWALITVSGGRL